MNDDTDLDEAIEYGQMIYDREQRDLADLQRIVWAALEDDRIEIVGFDRISDHEFGVEMSRGARCFITIELA